MPTDGFRYWLNKLDERQQKEIRFAEVYAEEFHHGTNGHNQLILIAQLAQLLDDYADRLGKYEKELPE